MASSQSTPLRHPLVGRRAELLERAAVCGWPKITLSRRVAGDGKDLRGLRAHDTLGPGITAWHLFAEQFSAVEIEDALAKLGTVSRRCYRRR